MIAVSPAVQAVADRILERELRNAHDHEVLAARLSLVFTRLHEVTGSMVGEMGYLALMRRVLSTKRSQFPWLPPGDGDKAGAFPRGGWTSPLADVGAARARASASALFAGLLGLLSSFIGEDFTLRLVRRAWPDEPVPADQAPRVPPRWSANHRSKSSATNRRGRSSSPKKPRS